MQRTALTAIGRIVLIEWKTRLVGSRSALPPKLKTPHSGVKSSSPSRKSGIGTTAQQSSSLPGNLLQLMDEERRRIAREVHDDLGQQIAHIEFRVKRLAMRLPTSRAEAENELEAICDELRVFSDDLRQTAHRLHPASLEHLEFSTVVGSYCEEFSQRTGLPVTAECTGIPRSLRPDLSFSLYCILREALKNVHKHAGSEAAVSVMILGEGPNLSLHIEDTGHGVTADGVEASPGLGLISIRERVRLLNGSVLIDSAAGAGVRIQIVVPIGSHINEAPFTDRRRSYPDR